MGHMPHRRFRHAAIAATPPMPSELAIGWVTHYLTGIAFAALLLLTGGMTLLQEPTIGPTLIAGLGSVAVPMSAMQPAMVAGLAALVALAARRLPAPRGARIRSLINHTAFAVGLYAAGRVLSGVTGG
ncbi:DUF2938 family protein [Sinimarinibacterium flocculans]|uniref:DUF2938 family protein n=1 Tax=Sinimarinibacterium flocculans TaxID=985250 RepID=UPI0036151A7D